MPGVTRPIEVKIPQAEVLADLVSVLYDLEAADDRCGKAIELSSAVPSDTMHAEALVESAVVKYCRCFATGVRLGLRDADIANLSPLDLESHAYFMALRNKFVAHSVNPFEETYITASATNRNGNLSPIHSIGHGQQRVVLCVDTAKALRKLITRVKAIVDASVASGKAQLLRLIQTMQLEDVHGGDIHTPSTIRHSDVTKTRRSRPPRIRQHGDLN